MMPILFEANTTDFSTMGIGMLSEATKVHVKRVLNGKDELELQYPVSGKMFNELINTRHILAVPEYKKSSQAYTIYRVSKPMNGVVTVNARHISERRMFTMVKPFSFGSVTEMFNALPDYLVDSNSPFTFYTDKSVVANCGRAVPSSLGAVLGGTEGSALDVYGGEYEFDMFHVKLLTRRGVDHGVTVEYGKNLKNLEVLQTVDESVITGICPIWTGMEEGQQMYLPEFIVKSDVQGYPFDRIVVVDFSSEFDEKPTETQLRDAAQAYMNRTGVGVPSLSIKVTFEHLAQYEEYKSFAALEVLNLGDTVSIHHADLDVDISARIVETAYDVLAEKYTSVTVGRVRSDMSSTILGITKDVDKKVKESKNFIAEGVRNATELITGVQGGYVVFNRDTDGHPYEILIMDTDDKLTATNCIRINKNGIGFSTNGYQGPFNTAWTIDGAFVADYITSGTLNANVIKAGILADVQNKNYWNLQTGELVIRDGSINIRTSQDTDDYIIFEGDNTTVSIGNHYMQVRNKASATVPYSISEVKGDGFVKWLSSDGVAWYPRWQIRDYTLTGQNGENKTTISLKNGFADSGGQLDIYNSGSAGNTLAWTMNSGGLKGYNSSGIETVRLDNSSVNLTLGDGTNTRWRISNGQLTGYNASGTQSIVIGNTGWSYFGTGGQGHKMHIRSNADGVDGVYLDGTAGEVTAQDGSSKVRGILSSSALRFYDANNNAVANFLKGLWVPWGHVTVETGIYAVIQAAGDSGDGMYQVAGTWTNHPNGYSGIITCQSYSHLYSAQKIFFGIIAASDGATGGVWAFSFYNGASLNLYRLDT